MTDRGELARLTKALLTHTERRRWFGESRVARPAEVQPTPPVARDVRPSTPQPSPAAAQHEAAKPVSQAQPAAPASEAVEANRAVAAGCADLGALREAVARCEACSLCETRTQTVFADGTERARVLFIGEAPGQHEDEQGVPFVGRAGKLLTDIVTKGMGLAREDVYIANVLKCRPPNNRDPQPEEKARCTPFLDRQIELVDPGVVITLGLHASQHVLGRTESMGRLRGRVHMRAGRKVVATYHPAFLLRSPNMKKACWEDIQLAMAELGLPVPSKGS